jgi:hypothetical protein
LCLVYILPTGIFRYSLSDFGQDRLERSSGMTKKWSEGSVCLSYDLMVFLKVEEGLEVSEEVRVEFEFCESAIRSQEGDVRLGLFV